MQRVQSFTERGKEKMNVGCGKFKCSTSIFGGWCGVTQRMIGTDVYYCKKCIKKFAEHYANSQDQDLQEEVKK